MDYYITNDKGLFTEVKMETKKIYLCSNNVIYLKNDIKESPHPENPSIPGQLYLVYYGFINY